MGTILNRRRVLRRGLIIQADGRITLRSLPVTRLQLSPGDGISFWLDAGQLYLFKDNVSESALKLSGRSGQLHCCSKATVTNILSVIPGITETDMPPKLELITSQELSHITIDGSTLPAVKVINRL